MTIRQWLAVIGLVFVLFLPVLSRGESPRVESLAGNRLFEDPSDVFIFPGTLSLNSDRAYIGFRPDAPSGEGGIIATNDEELATKLRV